ncbi:MAG: ABC transporter ATP-binding protein [Eubacteriales bacterium]
MTIPTHIKKRASFIKSFADGSKFIFFTAIIMTLLYNLFYSLIPQIVCITVDSIINNDPFDVPDFLLTYINNLGGRDFFLSHLYLCALAILIVAICASFSDFLSRTTIAMASESFLERVRNRLYQHISKLPYDWHIKHQTGDIIQRCTSDTDVVRRFVAIQLLEIFKVSFLIIVSVSIMWTMNTTLTLVTIIFIPIVVLYSALFFKQIAKKFLEADEKEGALSSVVQENLTGVRVVRAFGREAFELERFDEKNEAFAQAWIKMGRLNGYFWGFGDFFTSLQILCIVVIGTIFAVNGTITSGEFIAFLSYNTALVWPLRTLGRVLVDMSKAFVSMDRLIYILDAQEECDCKQPEKPAMNQDITFSNINYGYQPLHSSEATQPVLKDISFTIKTGSTFAILGGTGSGKTTLMHLLNRLYELPKDSGTIKIGDTDIRKIELDYLRENIGIVLQEPFLFSRSIKENIAITHPESTDTNIEYAASIACIDDSIKQFTHGYDTIVGERGITLSGGQKQRVAIARMLMQNTPIMIFDDSLSAVDNETDVKIRSALKEKLNHSTVILISHRITTLMSADTILVLDNGEISQIGSHQELMAQDGIYKEIYDIQMNMDDIEEGGL